jgi:hypothetical protein
MSMSIEGHRQRFAGLFMSHNPLRNPASCAQALNHIPFTLPPAETDSFVFVGTLRDQATTHAAEQAQLHLPTALPVIQSHDVTLPDAANHMSTVAVDHVPDWFI